MWKAFISLELDHLETRASSDEAKILPLALSTLTRLVIHRYECTKGQCAVCVKDIFIILTLSSKEEHICYCWHLISVILDFEKMALWFFFFWPRPRHVEIRRSGTGHSSDTSCGRDSAGSLTPCPTTGAPRHFNFRFICHILSPTK